MALTVGELNGIITIDDRTVDPALRRVEQAMRQTGNNLSDDAERSGRQAGQELGQGLVRGADGQWRNMRGELVDAVTAAAAEAEAAARRGGQEVGDRFGDSLTTSARQAGDDAGDALGDGLTDSGGQGADEAVSGWTERLSKLKAGALVIGAAAGAALMSGIDDAMEQGKITGRLAAQMGKTPAEAQRYGHIAGRLYADAVTEDFQGAADTISAIMSAGLVPPDATNDQIKSIAANAHDLSDTFELDLGQAANAAGQLIKTGLAKNAEEAFDVMTRGMQTMGPRADDLADTFNEYSTIFRQMGISASDATGLLAQGMQAGARDTDVVADALKELVLHTQSGGKTVDQAFQKIGLSGKEMQDVFSKGGPEARKALDEVFDRMRSLKNPTDRAQVALALFGTKAEDTQKALFALDPSKATDTLGQVGGAADKMGDALRDNGATKVEAFKRNLQQNLVDFLGTKVLPALDSVKRGLSHLWDDAGKGGKEGADRIIGFFGLLGQRMAEKLQEFAPKAIYYLGVAGQRIAEFIQQNPEQALKLAAIAAAIGAAVMLLPVLVAGALVMAGTMLMVNFVASMIDALHRNLPKWWGQFVGWIGQKAAAAGGAFNVLGSAIAAWFSSLWSRYIAGPVSRQWTSFLGTVQQLPGRTVAALSRLGTNLAAVASAAWQRFQSAASAKAASFIGWVRGLPGRIASGLGSLNSLLYTKGQQVVQGLWAGISGMGGWIRSKIMGWAKSVIPGPIAKALGIASPSKVTKAQGRWIARGLIVGLTGSSKQIRAASTKLADIIRDSLNPGKKRSKALGKISGGTRQLLRLASAEDHLAGRLKAANKRLADMRKARDKLSADVKKGVLDSANITQQDTGGWPQTADTILAGLQKDRIAAEQFAKNLATLRKKGVRSDLIAQIAQAGVEQGGSAAAALANANSQQIKAINKEQGALVTAAGKAGSTAGNAMYGAGIAAGAGLVKGLQSQQKAIERQMLKIAKGMSKAIRKALGIKSPSRVMALVGAYTAQGLVKGLDGERRAVRRSMASLVETPAAGSWDMASARARAAAAQKVVVEFRSSTRGEDAYLMGKMRRGVRRVSGGDVEFALAGRRSG